MQGGWQPPPGGGGYGPPGYGQPPPPAGPPGGPPGYGAPPPGFSQAPYPGAGAPMGQGYGQYEFNAAENAVIDKCANRAKLWGTISTVIGALQVLVSCGAVASPNLLGQLPSGIVAIVMGIVFMGVGNSLKSVVNSQGNDLTHMMQALEKLGGAFMVQIVCAIIYVVLAAIVILLGIFVLAAAAATSG